MNKKIEDYLPYYIGQEVNHPSDKAPFKLVGITEHGMPRIIGDFSGGTHNVRQTGTVYISDIKLRLRPLSDMTREERSKIWELVFKRNFPESGNTQWYSTKSLTSEPRWVLLSGVERLGIEMNGDVWADSDLSKWKFNPAEVVHQFLLWGFDLFNLIPAGLAVDKTKEVRNAN